MPILTWLFQQHLPDVAVQAAMADLGSLPRPPRGLSERITRAVEYFPCDILCIHRDAESEPRQARVDEIRRAMERIDRQPILRPYLCVIPVRMHEAWLLFDEKALRRAAGNPHGREKLDLPRGTEAERLADPKAALHHFIEMASGKTPRRLRGGRVRQYAARVSTLISDFTPLRELSAFQALEEEIQVLLRDGRWQD